MQYHLRTYIVRCARTYHEHCDRCHWQICPGDSYQADVFASRGHIFVLKEHLDCEPDPWEEEWELPESEDDTPDISPDEPAELPMAA